MEFSIHPFLLKNIQGEFIMDRFNFNNLYGLYGYGLGYYYLALICVS